MNLKKKAVSLLLTGALAVTVLTPAALAGDGYGGYEEYVEIPTTAALYEGQYEVEPRLAADGYILTGITEYESGTLSEQVTYESDSTGKLLKRTSNSSGGNKQTVVYTYNASGQLIGIDVVESDLGGSGEGHITLGYDENGNIIKDEAIDDNFDNNPSEDEGWWGLWPFSRAGYKYTYNNKNQQTQIIYYIGEFDPYWKETNTYDSRGNIIKYESTDYSETGSVMYRTTITYKYNENNQLIQKITDDGEKDISTYQYDNQGNLIEEIHTYNDNSTVYKYEYDTQNRLISHQKEGGQPTTYTYDSEGRLLSETYGDRTETYQYDSQGRLISIKKNGDLLEKYEYDNVGNLVKKNLYWDSYWGVERNSYTIYKYKKLGIETPEEVKVAPVEGEPQINSSISDDLEESVKNISVAGLSESAGEFDEATLNSAKSEAAATLGVSSDKINLYAQTYLQINSAEYDETNGTYSVDMKPMVQLIASTASSDSFNFDSGEGKNAVTYGEPKELTVTGSVEVSIPLPTDFTTKAEAYVQHKDYEYDAEVKGGSAIFTDPHGFSEFTVTKESNASAEMNGTKYLDLQKAVDEVQSNGLITVLKDGSSATVTTAKTFKVKTEEGQTVNIDKAAGYSLNVSGPDANGITIYTVTKNTNNRPSGSTSTPTAYVPDITNSENGTVSVYPKSATASMQITITVTPDEGYQTENLTVTDANGNTVNVTDNGDGTYTFIQPKSKVTITAAFSEIAQEPDTPDTPDEPDEPDTPDTPDEPDKPDTPDEPDASDKSVTNIFTDVSDDWYTEGVQYMYDNGLMVGVSDTVFGINTTVSRAMVAQILYANADKPEVTETSKFTDAPAGKWYTEAVAWAANNGIVSGYGDGTFRPNQAVTREELATMLYGAEDKPTVTGTLGDYPDQSDISGWAKSAVLWAVQKGIITGDTSGTKIVLNPKNNATRAQLAAMMMQYIGK